MTTPLEGENVLSNNFIKTSPYIQYVVTHIHKTALTMWLYNFSTLIYISNLLHLSKGIIYMRNEFSAGK